MSAITHPPSLADLRVLREFYVEAGGAGETLFDIWERGEARGDSVTPATFSPAYRSWIVALLERCLVDAGGDELLGVGCGNAVVEAELLARGHSVLAIDVLPEAVGLARRKGVEAIVADVAEWDPPHIEWNVIYADGILGHVHRSDDVSNPILRRLGTWLAPSRGRLVVSNDAASGPARLQAAAGVPGFCWLSAEFIVDCLRVAGLEICSTAEFTYERPLSGERRRAVVTARRAD